MESEVGASVGDKYFLVEIWEEDFKKQESCFEPTRDYRIYLELELPKRTWYGSTYVQLDTSQFFRYDDDGNQGGPGPILRRLVFNPIPPKFWLELTVHKRGKLDGTISWAHIQNGDKVLADLRRPKVGGDEGELESVHEDEVHPPMQEQPAPMDRRRTILNKVVNGFKKIVGKETGEPVMK
jgi:hypothetical protein